ncbi:MAG: hypothetical protein K2X75_10630 [Burkholderiaceae bacterium]|jgi:cell division protein FtsN|nr:hypothetical protein [Burkholderiaceae bacterium]
MKTLPHLLAATALACCATVPAQTVYRCGNSYSQTPCPGGSAVDATDRRTPEQRKAHEASVREEKRAGDTLEKTRLKEEAATRKATEQAEKAQRDADKAAQKAADKKKSSSKEKIPAYRAPAQN